MLWLPQMQDILQQVQTYQSSDLAYLINLNCFVTTANTRFKNFENEIGNLGDTVTFDRPPRYVTNNSLIITSQASVQRVQTLTVNNAQNVAITSQVNKYYSTLMSIGISLQSQQLKNYQLTLKHSLRMCAYKTLTDFMVMVLLR